MKQITITNIKKISKSRRTFLWFKPVTFAGWILLPIFHFTFYMAVIFLLGTLFDNSLSSGEQTGLFTSFCVLGLFAFFCNFFAMRSRRKYLDKHEVINQ